MYFMAGGKSVGERFKGRLELSGPPRCPTATLRSLQEGAGFALGAAGFRADGPGEQQVAKRRSWMRFDVPLQAAGELSDSAAGRRSYQSYLEWQAVEGPAGKTRAYVNLSRGWALGSREFKATLVEEEKAEALARAWETEGAREIREIKWAYLLGTALRALERTPEDLITNRKSAP